MNESKQNICDSILFAEFCEILEKVEKVSGAEKKFDLIFSKNRKEKMRGHSLFPFLRLLLPEYDEERGRLGLKMTSVGKIYISALGLDKESIDAKRLMFYTDPSKQTKIDPTKNLAGDLGAIM